MSEYGKFALVYALAWLFTGCGRAFFGEYVLLTASHGREGGTQEHDGLVCSSALFCGLTAAGVVWVAALTVWPYDPTMLVTLAISLPALLALDALRYCRFVRSEPRGALSIDTAWIAGLGLWTLLYHLLGTPSATSSLLGWAITAYVSLAIAICRGHLRLKSPRRVWRVLRRQWPLASRLALDFLASSGVGQAAYLGIPAVAGLGTSASLRAAAVALGPLNVVLMAGIVPFIARQRVAFGARDKQALQRTGRSGVLICLLISGVVATTVLVVPRSLGQIFLGRSWQGGFVAPILALQFGFLAAQQLTVATIRVLGHAGRAAIVRLVTSFFLAAGLLLGAGLYGAAGAAGGSFGVTVLVTLIWLTFERQSLQAAFRSFQSSDIGSVVVQGAECG